MRVQRSDSRSGRTRPLKLTLPIHIIKTNENGRSKNVRNGRPLRSLNKPRLPSRPDVRRFGVLHCCTRERPIWDRDLGWVRSISWLNSYSFTWCLSPVLRVGYHNTHWMASGSGLDINFSAQDKYSCFMGDASGWLIMSKKLNLMSRRHPMWWSIHSAAE